MTEQQTNPPIPAEKPAKSPKVWPIWLLLVLTIAALGAASFYGWHQLARIEVVQNEFNQMHAREQQLTAANNKLAEELRDLSQSRSALTETLRKEQSELKQKLSSLSTTLLQMGGASRTEWLLAEAEYLLRLANQRLQVEKDVKGATAVLQAADAVLLESEDAGLFEVRKKLQEEIMALQLVNDSDREGIYLELEAIIQGVDQLEQSYFIQHKKKQAGEIAAAASTTENAASNSAWDRVLAELNKLVSYRNLSEPVEPLLTPEHAFYLKQNLRLMLEQAQLAALKRNDDLYTSSINKASNWIGKHFIQEDQPVKVIRDKLATLAKKNISPEVPDISNSLNLLKARIKLLYKQRATTSQPSAVGGES